MTLWKKEKDGGLRRAKLYKFTAMAGHSPFHHSLAEMKGKIVCSLWFRLGQMESKECLAKFVFSNLKSSSAALLHHHFSTSPPHLQSSQARRICAM